MASGDYTDGHGWAMLDASSARGLADTMDALSGRSASKRRHMLLYCFSKLSRGNPPTFKVGTRTLANAMGYTRSTAREFLSFMDDEGYFVVTKKGEKGGFDTRTFWWFMDGGGRYEQPTPGCKPRVQQPTPRAVNPGSSSPHQSTEYSYRSEYSVLTPTPYGPPADAVAHGVSQSDDYSESFPPPQRERDEYEYYTEPCPPPPPTTSHVGDAM